MNNHNNHHNNEQRPDERPLAHILERALLHMDRNTDTVQHRSATPEYQITIKHGSIRIGPECAASTLSVRR